MQALASRVGAAGLDLIVTNQVRLIRAPQIMDALEVNPALTPDLRRRIQEVREEFFVKKELQEKLRQLGELPTRELSEAELAAFQEAEIEAALRDAAAGKLVDHEAETPVEALSEEEHAKKNRLISTLTVPEKVRLALRGSRSDRLVLVRDSNRLVATTVIRSPKMSESEVELIANMRNLTEEVLRIIGNSRSFLRSYGIIHALVRNPRTPVPVAMNLLNRISQTDLKKLESNRNVTETIRKQAKQILQRAQQRPGTKH